MMSLSRAALRIALCVGPLGALAGCGDWVEYDPEARPGSGGEPAAPTQVDEAFAKLYEGATRLDHVLFESVLGRYVVEQGQATYVDYDGLAASTEGSFLLSQYVASVDLVDPTLLESHEEKLAYWINAYNALVLSGVLEIYGGDAGYSVSDDLFAFFSKRGFRAAGRVLSLDELEHVIIRGDTEHASALGLTEAERTDLLSLHADLWGDRPLDPRIHVAVNCASLGCPDLGRAAFRADALEDQLAAATARFLANPEKGAGPDGISSLFDWFAQDFSAGDYEGAEDFIQRWRGEGLDDVDTGRFLSYDWSLNIAP